MVPGRYSCFFVVPSWFSWFQDGFHDFSWFQVCFSWFQVGFHGFSWFQVGFHGFSWFQVVFYGFSWFKVGLSWFNVVFHGSRSVFMFFHGSRLVFHFLSWEHPKIVFWPDNPVSLAGFGLVSIKFHLRNSLLGCPLPQCLWWGMYSWCTLTSNITVLYLWKKID